MTRRLRVRATGPLVLVQDLGRPGLTTVGVGRSGAADRSALQAGNRALGNVEDAAALEVTLGGLEVEVLDGTVWFCVTGAPVPVHVDTRAVGSWTVAAAGPGTVLRLGVPAVGLRSYLTVRGGLDVPLVLGSRSRDVLAGIGPAPVAAGDELTVGRPTGYLPGVDALAAPQPGHDVVLDLVRGPRDDWVEDVDLLVRGSWTASPHSDRVGMRLAGPALRHREEGRQLPSEGAWRGAVQVPPDGVPVVFLADHPVTGGYPVVAVVRDADVDRAAQVRPGQPLGFRWSRRVRPRRAEDT